MTIFNCEQGTEEWLRLRAGRPTASNFDKIVTAAKCDLSKQAEGYMADLVAESYVPDWNPIKPSYWMQRGTAMEPEARKAFKDELGLQDNELTQVGFILHAGGVLGCSPDSLILQDAKPVSGVEIKCPAPNTHVKWVMAGGVPDEHRLQVHGSLVVSGLDTWHFWSYYPGMKPHHVIVYRDEYTAKVEKALLQFAEDYRAYYGKARSLLTVMDEFTLNA